MLGFLGGTVPYRLRVAPGWTAALWLASIIVAGLFIYRSTHSAMRLRVEPPAEFFDVRPEWNAERRRAEERWARGYWQCAEKVLQWRYAYGSSLPDEPPSDFRLDAQRFPAAVAGAPDIRARYWQNLKKVWMLPQAWQKKYEWDTSWLF